MSEITTSKKPKKPPLTADEKIKKAKKALTEARKQQKDEIISAFANHCERVLGRKLIKEDCVAFGKFLDDQESRGKHFTNAMPKIAKKEIKSDTRSTSPGSM